MLTIGFLLAYVCFADARGLGLLGESKGLKTSSIFDQSFLQQLPELTLKAKAYTTIDIALRDGYPVENHYVTTSDGYILNMHRIPRGKSGRRNNRVALLQHGYMLADEGYDVWLGNARGNMYSRNHTTLDPDKNMTFWDFSWHEIGLVDLPAMIDYILEQTGTDGLYYAGHSQGTTVFYVMAAERPEYNRKIKAHVSLAPVAYLSHVTSPVIKLVGMWERPIQMLFELLGPHEFLPREGFVSAVSEFLCSPDRKISLLICENMLFSVAGFNPVQTNTSLLPNIMAHAPAGASTRQVLHYGQELRTGRFHPYDFGKKENLQRYKSRHPPDYKLSKITAPVYLIYSRNDWLASENDARKLCSKLGSTCKGAFLISDSSFNHLDFVYAYMLADEGYDVWMGNARGNVYSRAHTFLDPDNDTAFWDFSWHEVGKYDLPAMIDYVLDRTGQNSLYYTGHSLENNEKWLCPVCCKQGRTTRSGSTSSITASTSNQPVTTDQLTLIMNQLLSIASDIKDVKNCQTRLSNDIAECKSLLEQHSDKISQHDISIQMCLTDIQSLRSAQADMSTNLTAIEHRFTALQENSANSASSTAATPAIPDRSSDAEMLERYRRSHNILIKNVVENANSNDNVTVSEVLNIIDPAANGHVISISRLGAPQANRSRPLKISFSNPVTVKNILRRKKSLLSNPSFKHFIIDDDKTPHQMAQLVQLREDLRRRQTAGERDITIKYIRGHFRQYDYGTTGNKLHYGQNDPPDYNLKEIVTPVYLIYSQNDWLVTEKNTLRLCNELGLTCKGTIMVSDFSFNHLDFVYGVSAPKLVYSKVISIFDRN
nr:unnamed protein product [Callosobruchus chinensis]